MLGLCQGLGFWGFGVWGFRVLGFWGLGGFGGFGALRLWVLGFWGLGFTVRVLGFRVLGVLSAERKGGPWAKGSDGFGCLKPLTRGSS